MPRERTDTKVRLHPKPFVIESRILLGVAGFFLIVVLVYWFWSGYEFTGSVLLFFTIILGFLPGSYLFWWSHHMRARPEDRDDGSHTEAQGAVGSFPDSSIYPFVIGSAATLCIVGFVFPFWTAVIGGGLAIGALTGVVIESRRGGAV
ncbi:MAG: aa3-type cytochrome oxidase subunit IV [Acidimicrobiales bacterium]